MVTLIVAGALWCAYFHHEGVERLVDLVYFVPRLALLGAMVGLMFLPFADCDLRVITGAIALPTLWLASKG
jgi:hypothetical protein